MIHLLTWEGLSRGIQRCVIKVLLIIRTERRKSVMGMAKKILIVVSISCIFFATFILLHFTSQSTSKKVVVAVDEFLSVYNFLLDKEFYIAKIQDSTIVLKDRDLNTVAEYNLEQKIKSKLLYIENRDTCMIFWTAGFDDLEGIMFMKTEWTDETWDGLVRITRLQGNAYKVYTFN